MYHILKNIHSRIQKYGQGSPPSLPNSINTPLKSLRRIRVRVKLGVKLYLVFIFYIQTLCTIY